MAKIKFNAVIEVKYKKTVIVSGDSARDATGTVDDMIDNQDFDPEQLTLEDYNDAELTLLHIEEDF